MFRQNAMGLDFEPADGMRVTVRASASIFPRDGSFQLYVTGMRQAGQGELYIRFEKLKQKLMAEGLFDPARKREIPAFPRVIGVVTSQTGAAIRDIIHVARRRNPGIGILLAPCAVQGEGAAEEIVRAIERLNAHGERRDPGGARRRLHRGPVGLQRGDRGPGHRRLPHPRHQLRGPRGRLHHRRLRGGPARADALRRGGAGGAGAGPAEGRT